MRFVGVICLLFAACVGDLPPEGPIDDGNGMGDGLGQQVQAMFAATRTGGTCVGCHAGAQPPNLTSNNALKQSAAIYLVKPGSTSLIVTKGAHQGSPYLDPTTEIPTVTQWVDGLAVQ